MTRMRWLLDPRDPLVLGNGVDTPAFGTRDAVLPLPGTLAGMVRTNFALEIPAHPFALRCVALAVRNDFEALLLKCRHQTSLYRAYCRATKSWMAWDSNSKD